MKTWHWVLLIVLGPVGYFGWRATMDHQSKLLQQQLDAQEKELEIERESTKRSAERWNKADKMLQRLPFMHRDKE